MFPIKVSEAIPLHTGTSNFLSLRISVWFLNILIARLHLSFNQFGFTGREGKEKLSKKVVMENLLFKENIGKCRALYVNVCCQTCFLPYKMAAIRQFHYFASSNIHILKHELKLNAHAW
jgi:hypothetical protein